jgi:hypothetical protein
MFESALLRKSGQGYSAVDVGLIAETLMFYGKVHVLAHRGSLCELILKIGVSQLIDLMEKGFLSITYIRDEYAVHSAMKKGIKTSIFGRHYLFGLADGTKIKNPKQDIEELFYQFLGKSNETKILFGKFLQRINIKSPKSCDEDSEKVCRSAAIDLGDVEFLRFAVFSILRSFAPTFVLDKNWVFDVIVLDDGFIVDTNINFDEVNASFELVNPGVKGEITPEHVLSSFLEARADMHLSSAYSSDLITKIENSEIIRNKLSSLVLPRDRNLHQIKLFEEVVLNNVDCIREAINSGERNFDDFIRVLDRSQKFKKFLNTRNPDQNLIREYYEESFRKSIIDLPVFKTLRFFISTSLGKFADNFDPTGVGSLAISAADNFLVDKLLGGWRPSHFVNGPLKKFIDG